MRPPRTETGFAEETECSQARRGVSFSDSLKDTHDGLRGFELIDPDGYVLFFGRPLAIGEHS